MSIGSKSIKDINFIEIKKWNSLYSCNQLTLLTYSKKRIIFLNLNLNSIEYKQNTDAFIRRIF